MPRRNWPKKKKSLAKPTRHDEDDQQGPKRDHSVIEDWGDYEYRVRYVRARESGERYRCPGCQQYVAANTSHVVAWPMRDGWMDEENLDERRHWHEPCWQARHNRRPVM